MGEERNLDENSDSAPRSDAKAELEVELARCEEVLVGRERILAGIDKEISEIAYKLDRVRRQSSVLRSDTVVILSKEALRKGLDEKLGQLRSRRGVALSEVVGARERIEEIEADLKKLSTESSNDIDLNKE